MNITEILGKPVNDLAEFGHPDAPGCSAPILEQHAPEPEPTRRGSLWAILAVIAALVAGLAAGTYLTRSPASDAKLAPAPITTEAIPPNLGDLAELFTAMHLTGLASPTDLARLYTGEVADSPESGVWVSRSAAVSTRSLGGGYWAVTVAVDVLETVDGRYEAAGLQHYELTIAENNGQPVAVSAPSRVPSPVAVGPQSGMPLFTTSVPAEQATAVASFLDAYLTGNGEVARYVSSTSRIAVFAKAPYTSITVRSLASDSVGRVNVHVDAVTGRGGHHNIEYTLELTIESGVWEVSDLVPAVGAAP